MSDGKKRKEMSSTPTAQPSSKVRKEVKSSSPSKPSPSSSFAVKRDPMKTLAGVKGDTFRSQLSELAAGPRDPVFLKAQVPVRGKSKDFQVEIAKNYSRKDQIDSKKGTLWTQSFMAGIGNVGGKKGEKTGTKWGEMLPEKLSLDDATNTLRAVKSIMGHESKPMELGGDITKKGDATKIARKFINPAAASFVEDVTGELVGASRHTGSAIRAKYLSAKLEMLENKSNEKSGFRDDVKANLSQLNPDGAVNLAQAIHDEQGKRKTADKYARNVETIHQDLDVQIGKRFGSKHAEYMKLGGIKAKPEKIRAKLGDWWADQDRSKSKSEDYVSHKRNKHGIC